MKCNMIQRQKQKKEKKTNIQERKRPTTKMGSKHPTPLASEQTGLGREVW